MTGSAGSETATNWLIAHGYALEAGGYIPGKGFEQAPDGANYFPVAPTHG
jgi:hypothetical protein